MQFVVVWLFYKGSDNKSYIDSVGQEEKLRILSKCLYKKGDGTFLQIFINEKQNTIIIDFVL